MLPVPQLGSSVEKMSMIDAHSGFPTDASGYMHHQVRALPARLEADGQSSANCCCGRGSCIVAG